VPCGVSPRFAEVATGELWVPLAGTDGVADVSPAVETVLDR